MRINPTPPNGNPGTVPPWLIQPITIQPWPMPVPDQPITIQPWPLPKA